MATSKISNNTWIRLGDYSSNATISISGINFRELMVVSKSEGGSVPITIQRGDLSTSGQTYFGGGYALPSASVGFYATVSISQITTGTYVNGALKTATISVYYR